MTDRLIPQTSVRPNGFFDRFAEAVSRGVSRAWFFVGCVSLVLIWAPTYWVFRNGDMWQLVINTATTIVTFLLVALLQNATQRFEDSTHAKLDEILDLLSKVHETESDQARRYEGIERTVGP